MLRQGLLLILLDVRVQSQLLLLLREQVLELVLDLSMLGQGKGNYMLLELALRLLSLGKQDVEEGNGEQACKGDDVHSYGVLAPCDHSCIPLHRSPDILRHHNSYMLQYELHRAVHPVCRDYRDRYDAVLMLCLYLTLR